MDGKNITEKDIEALVKNAEEGFPYACFRKVGRPRLGKDVAETVAVRLDPAQVHALDTQANAFGISRSVASSQIISPPKALYTVCNT